MANFFLLITFLLMIFNFTFAQEKNSFTYDDKGKRDPFSPLVDKDGQYLMEGGVLYSPEELELSGILWDPQGDSSAIINNQIVKIGETIYGFTIKNITKDRVVIIKGEQVAILSLSEEGEKK